MGIVRNGLDFNSIEELKEKLQEIASSKSTAMKLVLMDENGNPESIDIRDMIEKIGLDETASLIFEANQKSKESNIKNGISGEFTATGEDIAEALEKFKKDPNSLTPEESFMVSMVLNSSKKRMEIANDIMAVFMEALKDLGGREFNTVSGMTSIILTILSGNLVISTDAYNEQSSIFQEKVRVVQESIALPQNVDATVLAIALLNLFGEVVMSPNNNFKNCNINHDEFLNVLGISDVFKKAKNAVASEKTEEQKTDNSDKIVDIRGRIKDNK